MYINCFPPKRGHIIAVVAYTIALPAIVFVYGLRGCDAETLLEALTDTYNSNPTLLEKRASLKALDEHYIQARSGYGATISAQGTILQDRNDYPTVLFPGIGEVTPGLSKASGGEIVIDQPLYTGGRVATKMGEAEAEIAAGRASLRRIEQDVMQKAIKAYADVRRDSEALSIASQNETLLGQQFKGATARFELREVTRTDLAQIQSRWAAARSDTVAAEAALADSRAEYKAVVGHLPLTLAPEPSFDGLLPHSLDDAVQAADKDNPAIGEAIFKAKQSAAAVAAAKTEFAPSASMQMTLSANGGNFGHATPFANYSDDVTTQLVFRLPIYSSGTRSSELREAEDKHTEDTIAIDVARRQVCLDVEEAWNGLMAAQATVNARQEEVNSAEIANRGADKEASAGQRTNLDVLVSDQDLDNARLGLAKAHHDAFLSAVALLSAEGRLMLNKLEPNAAVFDPQSHFNKIRSQLPGRAEQWVLGTPDGLFVPKE